MRLLFALFLLANVASADEVPLGVSPIGAAIAYRDGIATASNGHGFLAVSREARADVGIFGMRADERGRPLDPVMFLIGVADFQAGPIGVASDGDSYLVAWTMRNSVQFARIDERGNVAPSATIANAANVSIAWGGSVYVLGYVDRTSNEPMVAIVAPDGTLLRSGIPIVSGVGYPYYLRIAAGTPGTVVATWLGLDKAVHAVVAHTSALRDGSYVTPVSNEDQWSPGEPAASTASVANNGTQSLVVWIETLDSTQPPYDVIGSSVRARRLDANGIPISDPFNVAQLPLKARTTANVAVAWNGSAFVIAWSTSADHRATLIALSADDQITALRELENLDSGDQPLVALAGCDRGALFLWNSDQLYGTFAATAAGTTWFFSPGHASQQQPSIAWCGDAYRAVWTERSRVLYARIGVNGIPIDAGIPVSDSANWQDAPSIACTESSALVVWNESLPSTVKVALVDADGTAHPALDIGNLYDSAPSVLWNGSEYLVVWEEAGHIVVSRISRNGQPMDVTPQQLGILTAGLVSIGWNGSEYLLAWIGWSNFQVQVLRLSAALSPIGSPVVLSSRGVIITRRPLVISGNGEWLVAWHEAPVGKFARLDASLHEIEHGSIAGIPSDGIFTGSGYKVVTDEAAVSHGASLAAVIHPRLSDELQMRLYVSLDSGRLRGSRH